MTKKNRLIARESIINPERRLPPCGMWHPQHTGHLSNMQRERRGLGSGVDPSDPSCKVQKSRKVRVARLASATLYLVVKWRCLREVLNSWLKSWMICSNRCSLRQTSLVQETKICTRLLALIQELEII